MLHIHLFKHCHSPSQVRPLALNKGTWILGQDQDVAGGGFELSQRFIGKICNLRMWSVGKTEAEMRGFFENPPDRKDLTHVVFDSPPTYAYEKNNGAY